MEGEFIPWIEKYRPKTLGDVVGHKDIIERFQAYVKNKNLPHMLLCGPPGTGKTSSILALARELFGDAFSQSFLELNASDARGIDVVRGRIKDFARTLALSDTPFKIILLDEADSLTSDAQQALRRTMEQYSKNTRFALSANYASRIIEPIQSRCAVYRFTRLQDAEIRGLAENVARAEGLKLDADALDAIVYVADGDARKAVNCLQGASTLSKHVKEDDVFSVASRARPKEIAEMVALAIKGDFTGARKALQDVMIKYGLSGEDVIQQIYREVTGLAIPDEKKVLLVDRIGEYAFRLSEGANERIQLEALLAQLVLLGRK